MKASRKGAETQVGSGNKLKVPGTYHAVIDTVDTEPTKKDGTLIDGIKMTCVVEDGTSQKDGVCTEKEKMFEVMLYHPNMDADEDDWAVRKQNRMAVAANLCTKQQLIDAAEKDEDIEVNWMNARKQHIIISLEENEWTGSDGQTRTSVQLAYDNIWHVDDPNAAGFPRNQEAIDSLVDPSGRWSKEEVEASDVDDEPIDSDAVDVDAI